MLSYRQIQIVPQLVGTTFLGVANECSRAQRSKGSGRTASEPPRSPNCTKGYRSRVRGVAHNNRLSNNGLQLTRSARCAPFAFRTWGQSLRAALAAEAGCSTGHRVAR
jgi:hypothetical protein